MYQGSKREGNPGNLFCMLHKLFEVFAVRTSSCDVFNLSRVKVAAKKVPLDLPHPHPV
jgi:hypothetical protein